MLAVCRVCVGWMARVIVGLWGDNRGCERGAQADSGGGANIAKQ